MVQGGEGKTREEAKCPPFQLRGGHPCNHLAHKHLKKETEKCTYNNQAGRCSIVGRGRGIKMSTLHLPSAPKRAPIDIASGNKNMISEEK